jgi:hypothetical protein
MIDFEAFGNSIDTDLSKTPWPPTGPTITRPHSPSVLINQSTTSALGDSNIQQTGEGLNSLQPDFGWGMGMGMNGWGMGMGTTMDSVG